MFIRERERERWAGLLFIDVTCAHNYTLNLLFGNFLFVLFFSAGGIFNASVRLLYAIADSTKPNINDYKIQSI